MKHLLLFCLLGLLTGLSAQAKVHLFLLSGQSNMAGLNPKVSFIPTVEAAFPDDKCIFVKSAQGGQPIRRWYKKWKSADGDTLGAKGALYGKLIAAINPQLGDQKFDTLTFVWMQGERDAKEKHGSVYEKSMQGLIDQLKTDMKHEDMKFVIGRLSDFGNDPARKYPDWMLVREAQVKVAEASPNGAWIDTDDLNGKNDGLHYNKEGYAEMGKRFAEAAIKLLKGDCK